MTEPIDFKQASYRIRGYAMWNGRKVRALTEGEIARNAERYRRLAVDKRKNLEVQEGESAPIQESDLGRTD